MDTPCIANRLEKKTSFETSITLRLTFFFLVSMHIYVMLTIHFYKLCFDNSFLNKTCPYYNPYCCVLKINSWKQRECCYRLSCRQTHTLSHTLFLSSSGLSSWPKSNCLVVKAPLCSGVKGQAVLLRGNTLRWRDLTLAHLLLLSGQWFDFLVERFQRGIGSSPDKSTFWLDTNLFLFSAFIHRI